MAYSRSESIDATPSGDTVKQAVLDLDTDLSLIYDYLNLHEDKTTNIHGITGNVVGTTDLQTLTNKTLTSPTITGGSLDSPTLTTPQIDGAVTGTAPGTAQWNANKLQGATLPDPGSADDQKYLKYVYATDEFVMTAVSGGTADTLEFDDAAFDKFLASMDETTDFLQDILDYIDETATEVVEQSGEPSSPYPGMVWVDTDAAGNISRHTIADDDGDTYATVEKTADADVFDVYIENTAILQVLNNLYAVRAQGSYAATGVAPGLWLNETGGSDDAYIVLDGGLLQVQERASGVGGTYQDVHLKINMDTGAIDAPNLPSFSVTMSADMTDLSLGTFHTVQFDTEVYDTGGNFNTTTYTFTAPEDGTYSFHVSLYIWDWDFDATYYIVDINTSNADFRTIQPGDWIRLDNVDYASMQASCIAWMDANDIVYVRFYTQGGVAQTDIKSAAAYSFFTGHRLI